jgi:outer membrane biosynthesis protein TonB
MVQPPPAATVLGRIFSHRRQRRTVVEAPLVRLDPPPEPPAPAAGPRPERVAEPSPEPVAERRTEPPPVPRVEPDPPRTPPAPPPRAAAPPDPPRWMGPPEPPRPPAPPAPPAPAPPRAAPAVATRYCATCGDRVPVAPDGLRCHLGHRLSPAHAEKRHRRWFRRRSRWLRRTG